MSVNPNPNANMNPSGNVRPDKKIYQRPQLTLYGNIREITQFNGNMVGTADGSDTTPAGLRKTA